jgi:hypothetical protein
MKIAIGWLGLSENEAETMDMNNIVLGYEGKLDMLKACFGSSDDKGKKPKPSANELRSFAQTHNAVTKKGK